MKDKPLYRRYRYRQMPGSARIVLLASPDYGTKAFEFHRETHIIANSLFNNGRASGSLNSVCTAQPGGIIFQHKKKQVNQFRAYLVTSIWRTWQRYKVKGCTCRIATVLPDFKTLISGVDDCPIHGFGKE